MLQGGAVTTVASSGGASAASQLNAIPLQVEPATAAAATAAGQQLQLTPGAQCAVTVDLPAGIAAAGGTATEENGGVLLCNLDELSR